MPTLRLLMIDDSEDDYLLLLRELKAARLDFSSTRVFAAESLRKALEASWDLIICDYHMPGFGGMEALAIVRQLDLEVPFILMSGAIGEDKAVEAMRAGAQDYIMKGHSKRLVPAMERELREFDNRKKARAALQEKEEQLRHAQKMEAIGLLAGGLAHDFNNILGVVRCHVDMVQENPQDAELVRSSTQGIASAVDRASGLVRKLLAFGRKQVMETKSLSLNAMLESLGDMIRLTVGSRCELEFDLDSSAPNILADPVQIEQVIMNLVVNARDAMPEKGRLKIKTQRVSKPEPEVCSIEITEGVSLAVQDNGSGMTPAVRERIFEPYFTTKEGKGTGLGLPTVFGIVKQLHGQISVESESGIGTVFHLIFPSEGSLKKGCEKKEDHGRLLLVVEDEDALRKALCTVLRDHGYDVLEARSGKEALALEPARLSAVKLVVSDVRMPGLSGPELVQALKHSHGSMPVLFISGMGPEEISSLVDGKNTHFMQKPFNSPMFLKRIEQILGKF